jgi:hypothetical protein
MNKIEITSTHSTLLCVDIIVSAANNLLSGEWRRCSV